MKTTGIAAAVLAGLLLMPQAASAQVCVVGILAKALYANFHDDRELTAREAATCGILTDDKEVAKMKEAKEKAAKKKVARAPRKHEAKKN